MYWWSTRWGFKAYLLVKHDMGFQSICIGGAWHEVSKFSHQQRVTIVSRFKVLLEANFTFQIWIYVGALLWLSDCSNWKFQSMFSYFICCWNTSVNFISELFLEYYVDLESASVLQILHVFLYHKYCRHLLSYLNCNCCQSLTLVFMF